MSRMSGVSPESSRAPSVSGVALTTLLELPASPVSSLSSSSPSSSIDLAPLKKPIHHGRHILLHCSMQGRAPVDEAGRDTSPAHNETESNLSLFADEGKMEARRSGSCRIASRGYHLQVHPGRRCQSTCSWSHSSTYCMGMERRTERRKVRVE